MNADSNAPGVDNRFQSPGLPRSHFGGVRISFNEQFANIAPRLVEPRKVEARMTVT